MGCQDLSENNYHREQWCGRSLPYGEHNKIAKGGKSSLSYDVRLIVRLAAAVVDTFH